VLPRARHRYDNQPPQPKPAGQVLEHKWQRTHLGVASGPWLTTYAWWVPSDSCPADGNKQVAQNSCESQIVLINHNGSTAPLLFEDLYVVF